MCEQNRTGHRMFAKDKATSRIDGAVAQGRLRAGDVHAFLDVEGESGAAVQFYEATAACGFPSPADDYLDRPLYFNELLFTNPAATFAVRMAGESMTGAGISPAISRWSIAPARPQPGASCWRWSMAALP